MTAAKPLPNGLETSPFILEHAMSMGVSRDRLRAGDLRSPSRSVRVSVHSAFDLAASCSPYVQLLPGSVISHGTAGRLHKLVLPQEVDDEPRLHLARSPGQAVPRRKHIIGHRLALEQDEVVLVKGVRVTSIARTWLDLSSQLSLDELVVAGDQIVSEHQRNFGRRRTPKVSMEDLNAYIASKSATSGLSKARKALALMRLGVDSPPETRLRLILQRQGLPEFVPNTPIFDETGDPQIWTDLGCPAFRICIEYEGAHHLTTAQQSRDHERDYTTAQLGWIQVKINKDDMGSGENWVTAKVQRALKRRGWQG
ncbi:hypothetical protein [Arthrobacter roseus]|uniref:hypothetical protein n=1 Tax=Arthrobacter roseus TaxID=136274 RepID=UPI001EF82A72|nr:hypothetical protein [Arthrobacter roseus]MBM7848060.1 hypothetical protein [Arthrobacter roseus]